MVWFTVTLADKPGALAHMAEALGDKGINITAIVGIAEDTGGALMLSTSDPASTRRVFGSLGLEFEEHDPESAMSLDDMSRATGLHEHGVGAGS